MATTPNFGWPTPDDTDLVRDGAAAIRALGDAIDASADALEFSGLVAVKHVLKTDPFSASVTASDNVAVDDLEIIHEVADANNRLIISAFFGVAASSAGYGPIGIAVHDGTALIGVGDAAGIRTRTGAGGAVTPFTVTGADVTASLSVTFVHTPGSGSKTYTVRAVNIDGSTRTLFVNRSQIDSNSNGLSRAASALVIQEVTV